MTTEFVTTHANAASNTYALNTGEVGAKRLDIQSNYIHKKSCEHLDKSGLQKGQVVYDIASGTGFITHHLASTVGPEGHVYAVDFSLELRTHTQKVTRI